MTIRTICAAVLGAGLFATTVQAQGLPDWAAPSGPATTPVVTDGVSGPQPPNPPPPPPPVPIDGGLSLLALAGAGYAAHSLRNRRAD